MAASLEKLLELVILPPVSPMLAVGVGLALARFGRGRRPLRIGGRALAALGAVALLALSVPWVAYGLAAPLQPYAAVPPGATSIDAGAIVVLAGDVDCDPAEYGSDQPGALSLQRVRYAAVLHRRTGLPLLISGGVLRPDRRPVSHVLRDFATDELGVPVRWTEDRALDTRGNVVHSTAILRAAGVERAAVVTNAWHMPRALEEFERVGFPALPAPMGAMVPPATLLEGLVPRMASYRDSGWAIHEWVGRLWYALRPGPAVTEGS